MAVTAMGPGSADKAKTGALLGAACGPGALSGGADARTAREPGHRWAYQEHGRQTQAALAALAEARPSPAGAADLAALATALTDRER